MHCPFYYKGVWQVDEEQWHLSSALRSFEIAKEIEISDVN